MYTRFSECVRECGLDKYQDFPMGISRPSIELLSSDLPIISGCSKFGGSLDLPRSFAWPRHKFGDYRFIGQINLAELPRDVSSLPSTGLLSLFYAHDENAEFFWRDAGYIRADHFSSIEELQPHTPPGSVQFGGSARIAFEASRDVPAWSWWNDDWIKNWPIDESASDEYWDLRLRLHPSHRYLLGYPLNTTLAYDPTPGPEWHSLLTLSSDSAAMEWCWHDGDWLVGHIHRAVTLASGRFLGD